MCFRLHLFVRKWDATKQSVLNRTTTTTNSSNNSNNTNNNYNNTQVGWASAGAAGGATAGAGGHATGAAQPLGSRKANSMSIFIGNLSFDIDEETIRATFEKCGKVADIRFMMRDGQFKGCGHVDFYDTDGVEEAVKLNGSMLMNRAMRVDYA